MAAAFNPCGFAMLPAYMGLYLGVGGGEDRGSFVAQLGKALLVGVSVTAGFVLLFAAAGTVIGLGARSVVGGILPWLGLGIGVILIAAGAWLLRGGELYTSLAQRAATRLGNPGTSNARGYFLFGLSYGVASLSCTLPIFLAVVGTSFAAADIATSFGAVRPVRARHGRRDNHADPEHGAVQGRDARRDAARDALRSADRNLADDGGWNVHSLLLADAGRTSGLEAGQAGKPSRDLPAHD